MSQSPKTNILDLGVWCLLQSLVEYLHRCKCMKEDSLACTIEHAWDLFDGNIKFKAVHERWKKVLSLILLGGSGNSLVEKCRGIKRNLDDIIVLLAVGGVVDGVDLEVEENDDGAESEDVMMKLIIMNAGRGSSFEQKIKIMICSAT